MLCPQPKVGWDCSRRITLSNSGICGSCGLSLSCAACVPVIEPSFGFAIVGFGHPCTDDDFQMPLEHECYILDCSQF